MTRFFTDHGLPLLFIVVMIESFGIPLPGDTALIAFGVLAGAGHYSIVSVIALASAGAIIGDNLGYWHRLGRGTARSLPAGITCGRACSHSFVPGPLKLTAKPSQGWQFARWQGACHGTKPVCQLTLVRPGAVAAYFTKTQHRKK
jgi:hypothetical protein